MRTFLETERLLLRQFTPDDADLLVELDGDPRVMWFITGGAPTPRPEIEGEVLPAFLDYYQRLPGYGFWAALEKTTGKFLGWFHFRPAPGDPQDQPELGYRLRHAAWGKGYATEGSRALIAKGYTEFGGLVLLSQHVQARLSAELVGAGSFAYLLKDRVLDIDEFLDVLERVRAGGSALDPEVVARLLGARRADSRLAQLTPREHQVIALMAEGLTNTGIAHRMWLTPRTVETHVGNILAKLELPLGTDDHRRVLAVIAYLDTHGADHA